MTGLDETEGQHWVERTSSTAAEAVTEDRLRRPVKKGSFLDAADVYILGTAASACGSPCLSASKRDRQQPV